MYLTTYTEPGNHHHGTHNHLVFVIANATEHGLNRIKPELYTCNCGENLPPQKLDAGDKTKSTWPDCKSWRNGGEKRCPECGEHPSIGREQYFRAKGYSPTPKSDIKNITPKQREQGMAKTNGNCLICEDDASYVMRMVPPRYGGLRDATNLAPLCTNHYEGYGHMFADIFVPYEWHQIHGVDWRELVTALRDQSIESSAESDLDVFNALLDKYKGRDIKNPYPYITTE